MAGKFKFDNIEEQNGFSMLNEETQKTLESNESYKYMEIPIEDLHEDPDNELIYDMDEIQEIKETILLFGLQQPLKVNKINGKFIINAGHKRYRACKEIHEADPTQFKYLPTIVDTQADKDINRITLIITNSTQRDRKPETKYKEYIHLKESLQNLEAKGLPFAEKRHKGETYRHYYARLLKDSETQIQRYDSIIKNVVPEGRDALLESKINITTALELAELSTEEQKEFLEEVNSSNVDQETESEEKNVKARTKPKPKAEWQTFTEQLVRNKFQTKVDVKPKAITIKFENQDDLNRILEIMDCLDKE